MEAKPGITAAQVFDAIRRVKLPGGDINAMPSARGLANLESYFWLSGAAQPSVDLPLQGSIIHADFRVAEYQWSFGDGATMVTAGPGIPGRGSEVHTSFGRRGRFNVQVDVIWSAEAFLDGRPVGRVDDLVSRARTSYPVAEIRTSLTG